MIFNDILMIYIYIYIYHFNSWKKVDIKLNDLMSSAHTHVFTYLFLQKNKYDTTTLFCMSCLVHLNLKYIYHLFI